MPQVRTKIRPDEVLDVSEREYLDLKRQGLLIEPPETPVVKVQEAKASVKKEG